MLGNLSKEFGVRPSDIADPDKRWSDYQRYCFDGAILVRMRLDEKAAWDKARRESERKSKKSERGGGSSQDQDQEHDLSHSSATLSPTGATMGSIAGKVGVWSREAARKWVKAGGKLPPSALIED